MGAISLCFLLFMNLIRSQNAFFIRSPLPTFCQSQGNCRFSQTNPNDMPNSCSELDDRTHLLSTSQRLLTKLEEIAVARKELDHLDHDIKTAEQALLDLDMEFGPEIARLRGEFARIRERSVEESKVVVQKAKIEAIKTVLPITDDFQRAKSVHEPFETENENIIFKAYQDAFQILHDTIEQSGVTCIKSIGQRFDVNFMEAIQAIPSTEFDRDIVCAEYQLGYRLGDKCVRPAMVAVSQGPGPDKA
jgi:molecular chaperone GrpE